LPTHWVGIDEAGYGPNLGPLVMTAVVAASPDDRSPDVWADLGATVARAGGDPAALWIDDSKALYKPGAGRDRLEAACLALVAAADPSGTVPTTVGGLLAALGAGSLDETELTPWLDACDLPVPSSDPVRVRLAGALAACPFAGAPWRVVAVRSVVVGPAGFNAGLAARGTNKARVHFDAFARLLHQLWSLAPRGVDIRVRGDKHGGRHFYYEPLINAFPDSWIDRGVEGPALSCYVVRQGGRRLDLSFQPRADADDGLVALASIVSKTLRELWMDAFNAHWMARVPGLKPTAGYPVDAARFRAAIEPLCRSRGLAPDLWWRAK
jgi:hypothetical protein